MEGVDDQPLALLYGLPQLTVELPHGRYGSRVAEGRHQVFEGELYTRELRHREGGRVAVGVEVVVLERRARVVAHAHLPHDLRERRDAEGHLRDAEPFGGRLRPVQERVGDEEAGRRLHLSEGGLELWPEQGRGVGEDGEGGQRREALGALDARRDARDVGWEGELGDGGVRAGQPLPDEGGVAGRGEEGDGGEAVAVEVVREVDHRDRVALGQEGEHGDVGERSMGLRSRRGNSHC